MDNPSSAYVLRLLELIRMKPKAINPRRCAAYHFQHLTDRAIFDDLQPNERTAAFTVNTEANRRYADETNDQIAFVYANMARTENEPMLARLEVPDWVAADPRELDKAQAAIYANCEPEGYPYVLARAHELAVVSPGERARLEEMLPAYRAPQRHPARNVTEGAQQTADRRAAVEVNPMSDDKVRLWRVALQHDGVLRRLPAPQPADNEAMPEFGALGQSGAPNGDIIYGLIHDVRIEERRLRAPVGRRGGQ